MTESFVTDPVVVVGAGPTGLMLACELGLAGVRTVVLDRRAGRNDRAPGQAVNAGVVELLEQRGLAERLRDVSIPLPGAHFSLLWLQPERLTGAHTTRGLLVAQPQLEALLEQRAVELGVDIRRGQELLDVRQSADSVTARVRTAEEEYELRGAYLVAADGADSTVRELAGIGFTDGDWNVSGTVGDVETDFSALGPGHLGAHYLDSGSVYSGAPAGPGVLRVITSRFTPGGEPGESVALEELQDDIRQFTGQELPAPRLLWAERFTSRSGTAERYRDGRIFLAGDAAHSFFPLGGLRLSTCLQDAVNLGWKLAAELRGWAPPGLLDTYHAERHPEGVRARDALDVQLALMYPPDRAAGVRALVARLARSDEGNQYLVELVTGVDVRYDVGGPTDGPNPLIGGRLPGSSALLHKGRGVLIVPNDASYADDAFAATVDGWADRVDTVPTATGDVPVLLRPDGYVVWAKGSGPLEDALKAWFGDPS